MAAPTATAISAINATPPDAKAAMIMALTTAAVLIHLHIAMSLHRLDDHPQKSSVVSHAKEVEDSFSLFHVGVFSVPPTL